MSPDWEKTLRAAVEAGDYQTALSIVDALPHPPESAEQARYIGDVLTWALQTARIQRAHAAARLADRIRASGYRPPKPGSVHTWELDA